jgi:hypothetical protein
MRSHVCGTLVLSADSKAPAHDVRLPPLPVDLVFAEPRQGTAKLQALSTYPPLPAALAQMAKVTAATQVSSL